MLNWAHQKAKLLDVIVTATYYLKHMQEPE